MAPISIRPSWPACSSASPRCSMTASHLRTVASCRRGWRRRPEPSALSLSARPLAGGDRRTSMTSPERPADRRSTRAATGKQRNVYVPYFEYEGLRISFPRPLLRNSTSTRWKHSRRHHDGDADRAFWRRGLVAGESAKQLHVTDPYPADGGRVADDQFARPVNHA